MPVLGAVLEPRRLSGMCQGYRSLRKPCMEVSQGEQHALDLVGLTHCCAESI